MTDDGDIIFTSFCPRCDNKYEAETKPRANALVRAHLELAEKTGEDELHVDALAQWIEMTKTGA